jgi:hypothetical protein
LSRWPERILQSARAYKEQTVAEATGQTAGFLKVYEEYRKAPEVTRKRMYLETMERVLEAPTRSSSTARAGRGSFRSCRSISCRGRTKRANDNSAAVGFHSND